MWTQGVIVELAGTFMWVIVVCLTVVDKKKIAGICAPVAVGLSVVFAHFTAVRVTNCSINPARSLGAAIALTVFPYQEFDAEKGKLVDTARLSQAWGHMPFFWGVPIGGALLAVGTYRFLLASDGAMAASSTPSTVRPVR